MWGGDSGEAERWTEPDASVQWFDDDALIERRMVEARRLEQIGSYFGGTDDTACQPSVVGVVERGILDSSGHCWEGNARCITRFRGGVTWGCFNIFIWCNILICFSQGPHVKCRVSFPMRSWTRKYRLGNNPCRAQTEVMRDSDILMKGNIKRTGRTGVSNWIMDEGTGQIGT